MAVNTHPLTVEHLKSKQTSRTETDAGRERLTVARRDGAWGLGEEGRGSQESHRDVGTVQGGQSVMLCRLCVVPGGCEAGRPMARRVTSCHVVSAR